MKKKISNSFIKELILTTDIVEIISRFVKLKKVGKNFIACCPFHLEKTPSFSVSPHKQIYHCFGCHAAGDVISFLSSYERLSFIEAIEELANIKGIRVPFEQAIDQHLPDYSLIYKALEDANRVFISNLKRSVKHNKVISYIKERALTKNTINRYKLGFAKNSSHGLFDALKVHYSTKILIQAGLIAQSNNGQLYDRFQNRLIFPIYNRQGQPVGFGGRCLENKIQPKYLNSPETLVFHKSEELYGLYELKNDQKAQEIMVVEGYMDVTTLATYGYPLAAATLGTTLSVTHAKILLRETNKIIFCFDGDQAGQNAAIRAFQVIVPMLNSSHQIRFLILPKDEDPDSYITKSGKKSFLRLVENALGPAEFLLKQLEINTTPNSADKLAYVFERAKLILKEIPDNAYTLSIITYLAQSLQVSSIQLQQILRSKKNINRPSNIIRPWKLKPTKLSFIEKALAYALHSPKTIESILNQRPRISFQCFSKEEVILLDTLQIIRQNANISSAILLRVLSEKYSQFRHYLYQLVQIPDELNSSLITSEFVAILNKIVSHEKNNELEQLIQKSKSLVLTDAEKRRLKKILHQELKKTR